LNWRRLAAQRRGLTGYNEALSDLSSTRPGSQHSLDAAFRTYRNAEQPSSAAT